MDDNEKYICTECRHELPATNFHLTNSDSVKKILFGRVSLIHATSLLHFTKNGHVQELIHNLKYRGQEEVGTFLGKWLGAELSTLEDYKEVDVVIPVPLHKSRRRRRGYNQVTRFGQELAQALNAKFDATLLYRSTASKTQVFKNRIKRSDDGQQKFRIHRPNDYRGKHLLLVDDIITTGATVEACAEALNTIKDVKLSLATMAITD